MSEKDYHFTFMGYTPYELKSFILKFQESGCERLLYEIRQLHTSEQKLIDVLNEEVKEGNRLRSIIQENNKALDFVILNHGWYKFEDKVEMVKKARDLK